MRKVNPADVRGDFKADVDELIAYFHRVSRALSQSGHEKADVSRLARSTFLTTYVAFERFLSDLFLAYLNRDFTKYQTDLRDRVYAQVGKRVNLWAQKRTSFKWRDHIPLGELESAVDPDGRNLEFRSAEDIKRKAQEWLHARYAVRILTLTKHDDRLIDTAREIRNFIAHRSQGSRARMNTALASVAAGTHNRDLGRGANKVDAVGSFLKSHVTGGQRVVLYGRRLQEISGKM